MTAPVKVSLDVSAIPADPRGAGRYALDLLAALAQRSDVEVNAITRRHDGDRWKALVGESNVAARAPDRRPIRLAWEQTGLHRVIKGLGVAVHHAPHYTMPEASKLPCVVTVHDLTFFDHPEWHERSKVVVFRRAVRVAARHAAALVCVSEATAARLREEVTPSVPVHVIPHGVDHDRFRPDDPHSDSADLDSDLAFLASVGVRRPYVFFIGTLEPRKDVPSLVRAFDRVAAAHVDLQLVLAGGRGWGTKEVEEAIAEIRHPGRIVLPGYVPDAAVPALLRRAAAVAYPSLDEGFGLPALEAMACGAPLVTSTAPALAEVASGAALLVPPGDVGALAGALDMLVRGDAGLASRRAKGLEIAARHTWAASAARHVDVYRSASAASLGSD